MTPYLRVPMTLTLTVSWDCKHSKRLLPWFSLVLPVCISESDQISPKADRREIAKMVVPQSTHALPPFVITDDIMYSRYGSRISHTV